MKIIVNGAAGRMGCALRKLIDDGICGAVLAASVDSFAQDTAFLPNLDAVTCEADCIIDFSNHTATAELTRFAMARRLPLVIATTGQTQDELEIIRQAATQIPIFLSGNMSLGIALLVQLAKQTAKMFPDADIEIVESHHNQKLDVPSGTALMLANSIKAARPEAEFLVGRHENGKRPKQEIGIHSIRMGNTVGIHEVIVNTGAQIITLKHEAQDRSLFAEGALSAAAFLIGKVPGLYNMTHVVNS